MGNTKVKKILITVCVVLVAALVIGLTVYTNLASSGSLLRMKTAAETENFEVDGAMMTYFFNVNYQSYSSYISYLGVDTSVSLKAQECPYITGGTWFDYFASIAKTNVNQVLALCEAAHEAGVELDDADLAGVDTTVDTIRESAKTYGYSLDQYLTLTMGTGINEKDVRNCLELTALASKYTNIYIEGLSYTEEQLEAYYSENTASFDGVDYLVFTTESSDFMDKDTDGNPVGDTTEASATAKAYADRLAAAASEDEFVSVVGEYITETYGSEYVDDEVAACYNTHTVASNIPEASEWAFSASVGDTFVIGEEGSTTFSVYYLTAESYREEATTRNVRHILLSSDTYEDSTTAETVYADLEAAGFSDDKFNELVLKYSEDTGSVNNGGKYENVARGETANEFNAWLFDDSRAEGDTGIVESTFGWHIMQYLGEGDKESWMVTAESLLQEEDYRAHMEEYAAKITYNDSVINSINA